jgi:SAM-dependent methyltransferase
LLSNDPSDPVFRYIEPPFDFNAPDVSRYPAEVTGYFLLKSMCHRLKWPSLEGKRLLDFGCGVRFARTIVNLDMAVANYTGIDTNRNPIDWLQAHVDDSRLHFCHLNMKNPMYNPDAPEIQNIDTLKQMGLVDFDAACMFSVLTHQSPAEAEIILGMLQRSIKSGGHLYFTAFVDETIDGYAERDAVRVRHLSTFHPELMFDLLRRTHWTVSDIYRESDLQQMAFVCRN